MKNILLILFISILAQVGFAQRITKGDDQLDKKVLAVNVSGSELLTMEMKQELKLTQTQQQNVDKLNEIRYQELLSTENRLELSAIERNKVKRSVHLLHDKALRVTLTQQQLNRFLELEGRQNTEQLSEADNF
jgi:hypothetical protein